MTSFQRFIRLYNPKGVVFVGSGLVLVGLVVTVAGFRAGSMIVAMTGYVYTAIMLLATPLCAILAMIRRAGLLLTPAQDIILQHDLREITLDEAFTPLDDTAFMDDLRKHVHQFRV